MYVVLEGAAGSDWGRFVLASNASGVEGVNREEGT